MADKPMVTICSWCQKINDPQFTQFGAGVDTKVKEELKIVDQQVKANGDKFTFSHGVCIPHAIQSYQEIPGMTKDKLKTIVDKMAYRNPPPNLIENEPLRHAYMKGLFTPELIQQATKEKHALQLEFRQRFKKLAGLRS